MEPTTRDEGGRRGWLRWGVALAAVGALAGGGALAGAGLLAAGPGLAMAAGGHLGRHLGWHGRHPEAVREHVQVAVKWALRDVGADEAQQERVAAIVGEAVDDLHALKERHEANRETALRALSASKVDREELERVRQAGMELMEAASRRLTKAVGDAADVLTPEQRQELVEWARQRHQR